MKRIATGLLSLIIATSFTVTAMADTSNIDLNTLWDFSQPALSEQPQALAVQHSLEQSWAATGQPRWLRP